MARDSEQDSDARYVAMMGGPSEIARRYEARLAVPLGAGRRMLDLADALFRKYRHLDGTDSAGWPLRDSPER